MARYVVNVVTGEVTEHPDLPVVIDPAAVIAGYIAQLDRYFDQVARAAGFDSRMTFISRAGYAGPFQAVAQAFGAWMDGCYVQAQGIRAQVLSGEIDPPPTLEEVIAMLPAPPDLQGGA